jgi:NADPH:quinone reductase-like Zn-dependent oxidoreductase
MMKAVAIGKYGSHEELKLIQLPIPELGARDVLIEVHAAAVNPVDIAIRNGWLQGRFNYDFPFVPGWDVSGIIKAIGTDVTRFSIGDEVYGYPDLARDGTYAEFVAADEQLVDLKPKHLSFEEAASLPLVGTCAFRAIVYAGEIQEGQRVLILGGSGGVGTIAVQLAKSLGAYVVASTSTKNVDFVKNLGCDEVIDYTSSHLADFGGDFDFVLDTVGGHHFEQSFNLVKKGGKIISVTTGITEEDKKRAEEMGISAHFLISEPSGEIISEISRLAEQGKIRPVINCVFRLDEVQTAHLLSESRRTRGKIVLKVK